MAFTPILSDLSIDSIRSNSNYRNTPRENAWGTPVFFVPSNYSTSSYGYGGPKYLSGYNYDNSTSSYYGNCTWWCSGRLHETMGTWIPFISDAKYWYDNYSGEKSTNADNINPGDIIVFTDSGPGHVMFVEKVTGNTIYISHSAYSTRSVWNGYACLTNTYTKSEIYNGNSINMYKNYGSAYYVEVIGVIHTGESSPTPSTETPSLTISPSSYTKTMTRDEEYIDFTFNVTLSGIPDGYTASGSNTYPGLDRVYNTGWSYTSYTVDGVTYQTARKTQTLRYYREQNTAYNITKYMYYSFSYPNGSASSTTPMYITIDAKGKEGLLMLEWNGSNVAIRNKS